MFRWIYKLLQPLERMAYLACAALLFVLLYLWGTLSRGTEAAFILEGSEPLQQLFTLGSYAVYQFSDGVVAQFHEGALGYVFSSQELFWLTGLILLSQVLLWPVLVVSLFAVRYKATRRYGFSMAIMACVLLFSPVFHLHEGGDIQPWKALFLLLAPVLTIYFETRKYLPSTAGQRSALIAYASQTGSAKRLAEQLCDAAQSLVDVRCVSQLTAQQLQQYQRVFFVVSTHGNGEAPDSAQRFVKDLQQAQTLTSNTQFSVLALGDRTYKTFCAFGYQLSELLQQKGLKRVLPLQEVDRMDLTSVESWWQRVCDILGIGSTEVSMEYGEFTVVSNDCLNPSQTMRLAHRIRLFQANTEYQAGDVLAVQPEVNVSELEQRIQRLGWSGLEQVTLGGKTTLLLDALCQLDWQDEQANTPQALVDQLKPIHERLYSIASCEQNYVELLVRQHWRADGSLGLGSGFLTELTPEQTVKASIREHSTFHLVGDVPLIMIGAGTGLAPFIGFLKQKQQWGANTENWLIFGEQYAEHDAYYADELQALQANGTLTYRHNAWSRSDGIYVPAVLTMHSASLREWVEQKGAHIYLCGSRQGFGEAVYKALQEIVPEPHLTERLHTDLY